MNSIARLVLSLSLFTFLLSASAQFASAGDWLVKTVAGTGQSDNNGNSGQTTNTNISQPFGVEVGPDGMLYFTEVGNHRVWKLNRKTGKMTVVAGSGKKGYSGDGGSALKADLNEPYEVRFDATGNMYFVEMQNHLVRKIDKQTGKISTVAGTGKPGFGGDGGPATKAQFKVPHSIAIDGRGFLYIADIGNHRIRKVNLKTGKISTLVGNGKKNFPSDGDRAAGSPIPGPRALSISGRTLWIVLREGNGVWKMNLDDEILHHVAGTGKSGYTGDGGPAINATFAGPKGIAVGPHGNVFVVDSENNAIRRINIKTKTVETIAGTGGGRGYAGDGGDANKAKFAQPHGICVDNKGGVYIGDTRNHRIRQITFK